MVQFIKKTKTSSAQVIFDKETLDSLRATFSEKYFDLKLEHKIWSLPVAFGSCLTCRMNSRVIKFVYHDTAIVTWNEDKTITLNTGGFISKATQEKLNFALSGHGFVQTAWDGSGQWTLHLVDTWKPLQENGRPHYLPSIKLYDGLTFEEDNHTIISTEPRIDKDTYVDLFALYKELGGRGRAANAHDGVSLAEYDKLIDRLVKQYCELVITWENLDRYNNNHADCHVCDEWEEIIDRGLDEGVIKPAGRSGTIKEQCLGLLRTHDARQDDEDRDHLLQHVKQGKFNSSIVWIALKIAQLNPIYYMHHSTSEYYAERNLKTMRHYTGRMLRRMLHKGVVNVA
jgi:hypothetical protein